jgi:16S rRNA (adenine1518-N6/adenine1519-N6)-dimethyltransferase
MKKGLGQNFLGDMRVLAREASLLEPRGRTVLEIGAGDGRLTSSLLRAGAKKVIAFEMDPEFAEILKAKFKTGVEVVCGDFLESDLSFFEPKGLVAGNIPYYISSPIIFKIAELDFSRAVLMVQHEFALRMCAKPGTSDYGRLSVSCAAHFGVRYAQRVSAGAFFPKPKVDSAIVVLEKKAVPEGYSEDVVRALFQHKNKKARNSLMDAGYPKETVELLGELGSLRPRTLNFELIMRICEKIGKKK